MKARARRIPRLSSETAERRFWESRDSTSYVDWSRAERAVFPNLKPTTRSISLRLPVRMLERIKAEANSRDVPYQSLIKVWLEERLYARESAREAADANR
jgi:predicted DNA binding CopG/RHH family protein